MLRRITPVLLIFLAAALSSTAADRSAVILFGPAGAENARSGAHLLSSILSKFVAGGTAEIRGTGVVEGQVITSAMPGKQIDELTSKTARDSRETSPALFVTALDAAAQAAARMSGTRFLIAVVQNPPLSGEAETALQQVRDFCRANGVRVVLVDVSDPSAKSTSAALKSLIAETEGSIAGNARTLLAALNAAPARTLAPARPAEPPPPESRDIKVLTRFIRVSPRGTQSYGVERHTTAFAGNLTTTEGGSNVELGTGPVRGMFLVESPLSGLQFDKDDNSQTYTAKARVTQVARNKDGRAVWTARKEVTIHGPLAKLEARRAGNLYYLRDVLLPGGRYTLEATVEDLLANKTGSVREPLRTGDGLPGFYVSDAVCVRPFSGSVDRFEADQVFSYDGNAISPLLNPVFQPGEPFNLQIYFVMYPDLYGPQPKLSLEILQNGKVLGRTPIPFTDSLRDNSREGQGSIQGEQKRQFPYIASLKNAKLTPGDFEAVFRSGKIAPG
ncbi:MAG: hypothetical protein ABI693_14380, partial [Bryobacteraceae bacterium]